MIIFQLQTDSPSHTHLYRVRVIHLPERGLILSLITVWVSFWFRDCDASHDFLSQLLINNVWEADTQLSGLRKCPGWRLQGGSELTVELTVNLRFQKCSNLLLPALPRQTLAEGQDVGVGCCFLTQPCAVVQIVNAAQKFLSSHLNLKTYC